MARNSFELSRRQIFTKGALFSVAAGLPGLASAQKKGLSAPEVPFLDTLDRDGVIGPYGEVRAIHLKGQALPNYLAARDDLAVADVRRGKMAVRIGRVGDALMLTSDGVAFGKGGTTERWSVATVKKLMAAIRKDRNAEQGAMLLRSILHTSYPVHLSRRKLQPHKALRSTIARSSAAIGSGVARSAGRQGQASLSRRECRVDTVITTVYEEIVERVERIKTAEQQFAECMARECRDVGDAFGEGARVVCALGVCTAKAFVDLVVGVLEVVTLVATEVTETVVSCVTELVRLPRDWVNPWERGLENLFVGAAATPPAKPPGGQFGKKEIDAAVKFLRDWVPFFGTYGEALLTGKWSLAELETPIDLGGEQLSLPYGVRLTLTAAQAEKLLVGNVGQALVNGWTSALSLLAALSTEAATLLAAAGITPNAAAAAAITGLGWVAAQVATLIMVFLITFLVHATAVTGQLEVAKWLGAFEDGEVVIEHPTLAIALVCLLATGGLAPGHLIPPIVLG